MFFMMILGILFLFFLLEAYFSINKPKFGHTTGIIVLVGMACSFLVYKLSDQDKQIMKDLQFNEAVFFQLILPMIIFPSGYNMRRKKFFRNIKTIMKFGFIATLFCFAIYSAMVWGASEAGFLTKSDGKGGYVRLNWTMYEILSICSLLCSSDVIAAISMINYDAQPKLFSIVYGEGVFNDIVSIILFNTVQNLFAVANFEFSASTPFEIMGQFFLLALESVLLGLFAGILSSLLFKWCRFLCHSSITETLIIFIIAMLTYFLSEASQLSGIISLLTCGITMAHYTWYNLSPQGKTISSVTVSVFGSAAEGIVFTYIGLCVFTYAADSSVESAADREWSISFILWMTGIIIVGRIMGVGISHALFNMCSKTSDITCRELMFIMYGGMIRGAIAFGLVLKLPDDASKFKERGVIVTTTLTVVIITVLGFGSFMPIAQKILVPAKVEDAAEQFDEPDAETIEYDEQEFYN